MCPREMLFAELQFHGLKSQLLLHSYFVCFSFIPTVRNFNRILIQRSKLGIPLPQSQSPELIMSFHGNPSGATDARSLFYRLFLSLRIPCQQTTVSWAMLANHWTDPMRGHRKPSVTSLSLAQLTTENSGPMPESCLGGSAVGQNPTWL